MEPNETQSGAVPNQAPVEPPAKPVSSLETIHTYQSDIADMMEQGQGTTVKIAVAEQEKKQAELKARPRPAHPNRMKNIMMVFFGSILIVGSIGGIGYLIYKKATTKPPAPIVQEISVPGIITPDTKKEIPIEGQGSEYIKKTVSDLVINEQLNSGTIEQIYLTLGDGDKKQIADTGNFLNAIGSTVPRLFLRFLDPDIFLGIYKKESANEFFILLHTSSYNNAFASMLTWEPTLFDDFYKFFAIDQNGLDRSLFHATFKDKIIKNQDARALIDQSGNVVFFYTFLGQNKDTIIIARTDQILDVVLTRLAAH